VSGEIRFQEWMDAWTGECIVHSSIHTPTPSSFSTHTTPHHTIPHPSIHPRRVHVCRHAIRVSCLYAPVSDALWPGFFLSEGWK